MLVEDKKKYILVIIALCGLVSGSVGVCNNCVGLFYNVVSADLGILSGTFIIHNTLAALTMAAVAIFVPRIMNENNFKPLVIFGVALSALASIGMGFSTKLWQFYLLGILRGIGCAFFAFVVVSRVINGWYYKNHGMITSSIFAFSGVAGALLSPVFSMIIEKAGWQAGYIAMGVMIVILALPAIFISFTIDPKKMGILPYGVSEVRNEEKKSESGSNKKIGLIWIVVAIYTASVHIVGALMQHLSAMATFKGYSLSVGALVVSVSMIGNIVSKFLNGTLCDKLGVIKANTIIILGNVLAGVLLLMAKNEMMMLAGGFFYGFIYAQTAVGVVLVTESVFGKERYNEVYPLMAFIGNGCFAVAGSLIGYLYDFTGTYDTAFMIAIVMMVINIGLVYFVETNKSKA